MGTKGDSEKQATLRNTMIKKGKTKRSKYFSKILSAIKPRVKLLDIGCGTAHIIQELATCYRRGTFVGLDVSTAMLKIARYNAREVSGVRLVMADGLILPFADCTFDIVITRLAEYSLPEAQRVLKKGGAFFEYGLGPEANKEIPEFFPDRFERENFFMPKNLKEWKVEACKDIKEAGFVVITMEDYEEAEYYQSEDELMDLIEMVPLVRNFDRDNDRKKLIELAEKYGEKQGIKITWHYYIVEAKKREMRLV